MSLFPRTSLRCLICCCILSRLFRELVQVFTTPRAVEISQHIGLVLCQTPNTHTDEDFNKQITFDLLLHVWMCVHCFKCLLSHCSSSSHPETGWARAAAWYLHWIHGSGLPPTPAALVPQTEGNYKKWLHPDRNGLLPGLSRGLSDLPEPNSHQQWQLYPGGQQRSGNGHQDGVWSLPREPRWARWMDNNFL